MQRFVPPALNLTAFNCPTCGVYAHQHWHDVYVQRYNKWEKIEGFKFAFCGHCSKLSAWHDATPLFPAVSTAPMPNIDLPSSVRDDYLEARSIASISSRSAAALLRLALQKLAIHIGCKGENLNADIADLVRQGLPVRVQQALDVVRVVGNNAVHVGQLDIKDDAETAARLFELVNIVADYFISQPKRIDELYGRLPEPQRDAIDRRDA